VPWTSVAPTVAPGGHADLHEVMARDIPALYDTIASQVVDRLVESGEARVSPEFDSPLGGGMRGYIVGSRAPRMVQAYRADWGR